MENNLLFVKLSPLEMVGLRNKYLQEKFTKWCVVNTVLDVGNQIVQVLEKSVDMFQTPPPKHQQS